MEILKLIRKYKENVFLVFFSYLAAPFFYWLILLNKLKYRSRGIPHLRILVIQTAQIGDLVCTTPMFREIKKTFPQAYLAALVLSSTYGVVKNNPYLDKIILIDQEKFIGLWGRIRLVREIRKMHFHWSFSPLSGGAINVALPFWAGIPYRVVTTSPYLWKAIRLISIFNNYRLEYLQHTLATRHYLSMLKFLGIKDGSEKREVFITSLEEKKAEDFLRKNRISPKDLLIGITPTAGNPLKEWEPEKFAQLADRLVRDLKAKVVFIAGPNDRAVINQLIDLAQFNHITAIDFKLNEIAALLAKCKLLISVDTGPLYVANALGVPVIDIAGPIDIYEQPPLGDKCEIVQKNLPCLPCSHVLPTARACRRGDRRCLKEISLEDVFQAVVKSIKQYVFV